jgi:chromosome segregation ATPase
MYTTERDGKVSPQIVEMLEDGQNCLNDNLIGLRTSIESLHTQMGWIADSHRDFRNDIHDLRDRLEQTELKLHTAETKIETLESRLSTAEEAIEGLNRKAPASRPKAPVNKPKPTEK